MVAGNFLTVQGEDMEVKEKQDFRWMKHLNLQKFEPYPIQVANCERLRKNDVVYIFDEVGSGKTISSGLMALDYLYNNKDKNVLVITTNALVKTGQFVGDWYDKLPFDELGLKGRVERCNHHFSNFQRTREFGLIIIDEAHLFLNKETSRYKNLVGNISAEKVVFLTATPIKKDIEDLKIYVELAGSLIKKDDLDADLLIREMKSKGKGKMDIISGKFDVSSPVTRYFKDTIKSLRSQKFEKTQAKRLASKIWDYGKGNKLEKMVEEIKKELELNSESRFVVFTRFVEEEANKIGERLKKEGIKNRVVTGNNNYELSSYQGIENLPTVLVLTYQIAEQGVNLPGYNHVINYHISAFPSSLEQRFGRIDRMGKNGSKFEHISMCYLVSNCDDSNIYTDNFYHAFHTYLLSLLPVFPSKNTILDAKVLEHLEKIAEYKRKRFKENILALVRKMDKKTFSLIQVFLKKGDLNDIKDAYLRYTDLFEFLKENGLDFNNVKDIYDLRKEVEAILEKEKDENFDEERSLHEEISNIGNHIFYSKNEKEESLFGKLEFVEATELAEKISEESSYKAFDDLIDKELRLPKFREKYQEKINDFFETAFIQNDFEKIFPSVGYEVLFNQIGEEFGMDENEKAIFLSMAKELEEEWKAENRVAETQKIDKNESDIKSLHQIPFFEMANMFRRLVIQFNNEKKEKFTDNPLNYFYNTLKRNYDNRLSKVFEDKKKDYFYTETDEGDVNYKNKKITSCSNWFKLFYICAEVNSLELQNFVFRFHKLSESVWGLWNELMEDRLNIESIAYDGEENYEVAERIKSEIYADRFAEWGERYYDTVSELLEDRFDDELSSLRELKKKIQNTSKRYYFDNFFYNGFGLSSVKFRKVFQKKGIKGTYLFPIEKVESGRYVYLPQIAEIKDKQKIDIWSYLLIHSLILFAFKDYVSILAFSIKNHYYLSDFWWKTLFMNDRCLLNSDIDNFIQEGLEMERLEEKIEE